MKSGDDVAWGILLELLASRVCPRTPTTRGSSWDGQALGHGLTGSLSGRHRWQGPPPWPSGLYRGQAAPQRSEDRRGPLRSLEHLGRVLPREAYVNLYDLQMVPDSSYIILEHPRNEYLLIPRSQVRCPPPQDHPLQPHSRWSFPLPCSLAHLLQGRPRHDPPQDLPWCRRHGAS